MSTITDRLTSLSIDYASMVGDILPNMHRSMFVKTQWVALKVVDALSGPEEYLKFFKDIPSIGTILKIHNGQQEVLREEVTIAKGTVSTNTDPEDIVEMPTFKSGNELILYTPSSLVGNYINVDLVEKVEGNMVDTLYSDLISLFYHLAAEDHMGVLLMLRRIDTTVMNTVAENTKVIRRVIRPSGITPWPL